MAVTAQPVDETIRILFIQSDPAAADIYKLKLELDGYQISVLDMGDKAIDHACLNRPDMIYLDIRRQEAEGLATLRALRAAEGTRYVPVVILSNHSSSEMADRGFKADVLDHVIRVDPGPTALSWKVEDWARIEAS